MLFKFEDKTLISTVLTLGEPISLAIRGVPDWQENNPYVWSYSAKTTIPKTIQK